MKTLHKPFAPLSVYKKPDHTMYRILLSIVLIFISVSQLRAAEPEMVLQADSAFTSGEFDKSAHLYAAAIDSLGASADLYYNLGNAYYRTGKPGQAVIAYERALRIDPTHAAARINLEFVNSRLVDKPGARGTLLENIVASVCDSARPDAWAWIAFALFVLTLGCAALYCFTGSIALRKVGFFGGFALLIVTAAAVFIALTAASRATDSTEAVVVKQSTILSTSPSAPLNPSQEAMMLHEGAKVQIVDSVVATSDSIAPVWYDVQVDNSHRAWINSADVEKI